MIEEHEDDIEDWFFNHKAEDINKQPSDSSSLGNYLCKEGRMLKSKGDRTCLTDNSKSKKKKSKKLKGEAGHSSSETDVNHTEL